MSEAIQIQKKRGRIPQKLPPKPQEKPKAKLRGQIKEAKKMEKTEVNDEEEIVFISSTINEVFATSEVIQNFTNNLDQSIELTISFPLKPEIQLTKFIVSIGNKMVISKVLPKEKAEEKYTDAISSGNTGVISTFDENYSNYTINVGNVLPLEKVKLTSVYNQMITSEDMSYEFAFLEQYPCFIYGGKKVQYKKIKGKFVLNTKSKITRLISPFMDETAKKSTSFNVNFNDNYTQAIIDFNKEIETEEINEPKRVHPLPLRGRGRGRGGRRPFIGRQIQVLNAINNNTIANVNNINNNIGGQFPGLKNRFTALNYFCFLFRTEKMNTPKLYYQYDPETKETAYCLNYIYSSKNLKNIPVPEKPDQDNNISYYAKYQENLINESPGLFIFLVDQSGSMRGNSINLVKKALALFIQSLPPKSYFQLIGFGTNFHKYNESPIEYNKENVKNILSTINDLQANMGGTNISDPLKDIFENKNNTYDKIPLSKNIFLLTDGQVNNRESCIDLISVNSNRFRIHALGIGNDFDKVLIERSGKLGKGSSSFVEDVNKINEVVIDTLNKCLRPYLVDLSFSFNNDSLKNPILLNEPINNFTYQDEVVSYSYILDAKNKFNIKNLQLPINVKIKAKDPINEINEEINLSDENIIALNKGDNLIKIIIGQGLKHNKKLLESVDVEVEFAKKYQILSKNTALFGEILKDGSSPQTELIKVNLNEERRKIVAKRGLPVFSAKGRAMKTAMGGRFLLSVNNFAKPMTKMGMSDHGAIKMKSNIAHILPSKKANKKITKTANEYTKKPSFVQRDDGSIGLMDDFNDMLMSQDIIEGFWDENKETKKVIDKVKKEKYDKIVEYVKNKNISQDFNKIVYTILVIYYVQKEKAQNINEFRLVLNKAKKFLISKGINYDEAIQKMNI